MNRFFLRALCRSCAPVFLLLPIAGGTEFGGGAGTPENPFRVATAAHLDAVRNHRAAIFVQVADIDLSGYAGGEGWVPIGRSGSESFAGVYDGAGHVITGLVISRPSTDTIGLFGYSVSTFFDIVFSLQLGS